jgi:hypothetical protein
MQVNDKLFDEAPASAVIAVARENSVAEAAYMELANAYFKNPRPIFFTRDNAGRRE